MRIMCDHSPKLLRTRSRASESNYRSIQAGSSVVKGQPLAFEVLLMLLLKSSLLPYGLSYAKALVFGDEHCPPTGRDVEGVSGDSEGVSAAPGLGS